MNFLDPTEWTDLENLAKEFKQETLTEDRVKELHVRLRPYFLRRIKAEVLKLPPKVSILSSHVTIAKWKTFNPERSHCARQHVSFAERDLPFYLESAGCSFIANCGS